MANAAILPQNAIEATGVYPKILGMTRNIRGYINRAKREHVKPDQLERQTKLLCGKHAINHLLQEEKVVWRPELEQTYIPNGNPMDSKVKVNLADYCNTFYKIYKAERNIPEDAADPDCDLVNGNLTSDMIQVFLANDLRYKVEAFSFSSVSNSDDNIRKMRSAILKPEALGALVNIGGYHWTAISQNLESCRKRTKGRLESFRWAYLDSLASNVYSCADMFIEIQRMIQSKMKQVIVVSYSPASYVSTAVERSIRRTLNGKDFNWGLYPIALPSSFKNELVSVPAMLAPAVTNQKPNTENNAATFHNNNNASSVRTFKNNNAATRKGGRRRRKQTRRIRP